MSTKVQKTVVVDVPVSTVYNQWTQFEDFPRFMNGVKSVTQLTDDRLEWVAEIGGVRRQWEARIVEQVPDRRVAWAATEGATNAGAVSFEDAGGGRTTVQLFLEYEPEGLVEKVGDTLDVVEKQAEGDLQRFKEFIEDEGYATGAWRGSVNEGVAAGTPGVEQATASRGDDGKAGVSGKAVAAGAAVAGAVVAGAAAAAKNKDSGEDAGAETSGPVATPLASGAPVHPETPAYPEATVGPGTTVAGEGEPVPGPDSTLADNAVEADPGADRAARRPGDGLPSGGAL